MLSRDAKISTDNRSWFTGIFVAMTLAIFLTATPPISAYASTEAEEPEKAEEDNVTKVPEIPETVVVPDTVSLTIVLRKSGAIRQIVLNIWLEGQTKQSVGVIEQK